MDKRRRYRLIPKFGVVAEQKKFDCSNGGQTVSLTTLILDTIKKWFPNLRRNDLMASFTLTDTQQVDLSFNYVDKKGNPTSAPANAAAPEWMVDNEAVAIVTPSGDRMSCTIVAVGPLGTVNVSVKVNDNDGNPLASGSIEVNVVSGAPTTINIVPGTPTEQS